MPLVCSPSRGPPLKLAAHAQRAPPTPPRAIAPKRDASAPPLITRRAASTASLLLAAIPFPALSPPQLPVSLATETEAQIERGGGAPVLELERYTDQDQGFTLLKPASWPKVQKAGATALFQQEGKRSNNIGIVVNPVRLSSLPDFGTLQFVADRLLQEEMKKESTKSAEVISTGERSGHSGVTVYEIEYSIDSTRGGMKRVFSAAFVASRKLYLLNISYSDTQEKPLDSQTRLVLEQVLHSFDTV